MLIETGAPVGPRVVRFISMPPLSHLTSSSHSNKGYIEPAGPKHPNLLGKTGRVGWGEIWDELEPLAQRVLKGETVSFKDHFLIMERNGYKEETYHDFSYLPVRDGKGNILGVQNPTFECVPINYIMHHIC